MRRIDHKAIFKTRINQLADELGDGSPERLAAELRLPGRNIGRYCAGEVMPRLGEAALLASRAGVSLDWLTGLSDERVVRDAREGAQLLAADGADDPTTAAHKRESRGKPPAKRSPRRPA